MKLDHIAFRVRDKAEFAAMLSPFRYRIAETFTLQFEEGEAKAYAMSSLSGGPDVFVSDGQPGTPVGDWVEQRGPGIHHLAFEVGDIEVTQAYLAMAGFKFGPLVKCNCDTPLLQTFSQEREGLVIELLVRNGHPGFCRDNVQRLMESTRSRESG